MSLASGSLQLLLIHLCQQSQQLQSGQSGGGGGESSGEAQGGEGDQENNMSFDSFQLPPPEEFQSPEEYRRALIEGMQADVPDEFRSLKKRYYEELVQQ